MSQDSGREYMMREWNFGLKRIICYSNEYRVLSKGTIESTSFLTLILQ